LDAIRDFFKSSELSGDFQRYKELLEVGAFDKNGLKKKRKERPLDPWKVKYFEEYWGQKKDGLQPLDNNAEGQKEQKKEEEELFYFVNYEKDHPRPEKLLSTTTSTSTTTTAEDDYQIMRRLKKKRRRNSNSDEKKEKRVGLSRRRKNKPGMRVLSEEEEKRKERRSSLAYYNTGDDFEIEELDSDEHSAPTTPVKSKPKEKKQKKDKHSFRDGAFTILKREKRPLSAQEIARIGLEEGSYFTNYHRYQTLRFRLTVQYNRVLQYHRQDTTQHVGGIVVLRHQEKQRHPIQEGQGDDVRAERMG